MGARVLAVYLIGFVQGAGAHIRDLVRGGIHAYSSLPQTAYNLAAVRVVSVTLRRTWSARCRFWIMSHHVQLDPAASHPLRGYVSTTLENGQTRGTTTGTS